MNADFDLYRLPDEHEAIREAVRAVCTDKVAPHAAEVDEAATFPAASYDALRAADFHAPHIPEEYGGAGADALATCIVIEEVARACASTSLIPGVNKLGTMPLLLAASEDVKSRYLPPVARGEAMFSYGLSEREAGSDTASMATRAVAAGAHWVLKRHNSGINKTGQNRMMVCHLKSISPKFCNRKTTPINTRIKPAIILPPFIKLPFF
jgi:alkylation response protein AidB-like acyl-CoA dehydrogenase